jgi:small subunit ribosomal protein S18
MTIDTREWRSDVPFSRGGRSGGGGGRGRGGDKKSGDKQQNQRRPMFRRRKVCKFCADKIDDINYKDVKLIGPFVPERGKILPRRISGTCAMHQRKLQTAIKRARQIALVPYVTD